MSGAADELPELPDDLDALETPELLELLGQVGPIAVARQRSLSEATAARARLLIVLDTRGVSYRRCGKVAQMSHTAVLKALQRAGRRQAPPPV